MAKKKVNNKECVTLRAMANLFQKGSIKNSSAKEFIDYIEEKMPNSRIIAEISEKLSLISNPTSEEISLLKQILQQHFSFDLSESNVADFSYAPEEGKKHGEVTLSSEYSITDCTNIIHDYLDEYCMILDCSLPTHQFLLKYTEVINETTLVFSNHVFGNFRINADNCIANKSTILAALKREKITAAILNSFGYISLENSCKCSSKLKSKIFELISSIEPPVHMNRNGSSKLAILKVGEIEIFSGNKHSVLNQYLIQEIDIESLTATLYLSYGEIDIESISTSLEYYNNVANILLSKENLNTSAYIGALDGTDIIRKEALDFGPAICYAKEL